MWNRRATRFATTKRVAVTVVFVGLVLIALGVASGFFSVPSVVGSQNSFGNVNDSTTVNETDLIVPNPNPVGARFGGVTVNYTVSMNGIAMATGPKDDLSIATSDSIARIQDVDGE